MGQGGFSLSESNDNPSALVEVSDELAALINGTELPPESPPAPAPVSAPEPPAAVVPAEPSAPALPDYIAEIPADQRVAVAQRFIESLSPEERNRLPAIQETARGVQQLTAQQVQQQTHAAQQQSSRDAALQSAATTFANDVKANLHPDSLLDVDGGTNTVIEAAQAQYHDGMASAIEIGLLGTMAYIGLQGLPAGFAEQVEAAPDYGAVIRLYGDLFANSGYERGRMYEREHATQQTEADKTVLTARYKSWGIAQAVKDGRLRIARDDEGLYAEIINDTPPPLGSGAVSGGGDDISQEEFDKAVADPDFYDRLMDNPAKKAAWNKAIAEASAV